MNEKTKYLITTDEMVKLYTDGLSLTKIGKIAECPHQTVHKRLLSRDVKMRKRSTNYSLHITKEEIKQLFTSGMSIRNIAEKAGCDQRNIRDHLKRMDVDTGPKFKLSNEEMTSLYIDENYSLREISKIAGCALETVRRRLLKKGVPIRGRGQYTLNITKEEIQRLYIEEGMFQKEIGKIAGCGYEVIGYHLRQMGVEPHSRKKRFNISHSEICEMYNETLSGETVAKKAGCTVTQIYNILEENNIARTGSKRQYILGNDRLFEHIDTETKAYILGLLYADGCNEYGKDGYNITLALKYTDRKLVEEIRDILYPGGRPIYDKGFHRGVGMSYLVVSNKVMSNDLKNKGVIARKSLILTWPDFELGDMTRHFIRGYFDGDGWVTTQNRFGFVGTLEFITDVQKALSTDTNIPPTSIRKNDKASESNTYVTEYSGKQSYKKFYDYIYKDATIYLERKHQRFLDTFDEWKKRGVDIDNLVKNAKFPKLDI